MKSIYHYIEYHIIYIRKEGFIDLFRKIWRFSRLIFILFFSILLLPIIIFIRIIRPFVLIRFGCLWNSRIGHYATNTELYLCMKDAELQKIRTIDMFFNETIVSNYQLKKMWERTLHVSNLASYLYKANRLLPGYKKHIIPLSKNRDINSLYEQIPPHVSFTHEEEKRGLEELRKMGISNESKFICFINRDSAYLNSIKPNTDWSYHNYRNCDGYKFIVAAEELIRRGYFAIRMGSIVKESLNTNNPRIIDYATKYRTDFMDIYLCSKCYFFISPGIGLDAVPALFRRPILYANFIPFEQIHSWGSNYLFIPKKLRLTSEKRFMTFREILESGAGKFGRTEQYEQAGIKVVENTPEEIRNVTIEMDERLKGTWQTTEEDEELQQRFWSLFKSSKFHGVIRSRIGRDFLRQNKELLE